jgi:hypothetical protein
VDNSLCDNSLARQLQTIFKICTEVTKSLVAARMQKVVGQARDVAVTLDLGSDLYKLLSAYMESE